MMIQVCKLICHKLGLELFVGLPSFLRLLTHADSVYQTVPQKRPGLEG